MNNLFVGYEMYNVYIIFYTSVFFLMVSLNFC